VPETLGDAVLGRARRLAARTLEVASAAAVIGRSFGFDLLTAITDADPDEVATALRELQDAYFVLPGSDAVSFDFRHALIRDSLYADTDLPVRCRLHERVALTAAKRGYRGAFISAHFEQAGCPVPAYEYAVAAAREASAVSAHGEALELCRRAVRNLPAQLPALDRAGVFTALGDEAAATDDNLAAAEAYQRAHELISAAGEVRAAAALVPRMVAVAHLLGAEGAVGAERMVQRAGNVRGGVQEGPVEIEQHCPQSLRAAPPTSFIWLAHARSVRAMSCCARAQTASAVSPSSAATCSAGADSPKRSMPTTSPSKPV